MKNADLAILGLIVEQPRYGYEIEQVIEERNMREWTEIGFSSIYHILGRLEKNGYLTARLEAAEGRGPARRVYEVTEDGRAAWRQASLEALSNPARSDQPFYLGLVGLLAISPDEVLDALDSYQQQLEARRKNIIMRRQGITADGNFIADAMFDYGQHLVDAEMAWIKEFKKRLAGGNEPSPGDLISS